MPTTRLFRRTLTPVLVFAISAGISLSIGLAAGRLASPQFAYFDDLADALLHGRLFLTNPPTTHDLTMFQGKWYVPFPPLPALLMLPWVRLLGVRQFSTVVFSIVLGATNAALVFLILRALADRGWTRLNTRGNLWLTALFALGTVHWYMALAGSVWFVGQIAAVTFIALAVWCGVTGKSAWFTGAVLGLAMLARPTVAFTWPLLLGIALQHQTIGEIGRRPTVTWIVQSVIPMLLAVAAMLAYNAARFRNPLDFGYLTENVADWLRQPLHTYGQLNLHFVPQNLRVMLAGLPRWRPECGLLAPDVEGMSLLITTPALIYVARAFKRTPLALGAWISWALLLVPLLVYYNTGAWQFGYRFALDFVVPIMVLLAIGAGAKISWRLKILILISIAINAIGVAWWLGQWCGFP